MDTRTARLALSGHVWDQARWIDGRRVIAAPLRGDMAMRNERCRVMPATAIYAGAWPDERIVSDPLDEAVETTWEQVAVVMLGSGRFPPTGERRTY